MLAKRARLDIDVGSSDTSADIGASPGSGSLGRSLMVSGRGEVGGAKLGVVGVLEADVEGTHPDE